MDMKYLLAYSCFLIKSTKVEICLTEIQISVCFWKKLRNENISVCIKLKVGISLVKVGCYDSPSPRDGPRNSQLFCKRVSLDVESYMRALN